MKIAQIIHFLEEWAPPALQESYDNSGLLLGDKNQELTTCLITLDITEEVLDEAIANDCNLIIAHHPLIFSGIKKLNGRDWVQRTAIKAIKNDIAIYALHTNLDNVLWGVNRKIGEILGLQKLRILEPKRHQLLQMTVFAPPQIQEQVLNAMWAAGAGQIGHYKDCAFVSEGKGSFRPTGEAQPSIGQLNKLEILTEHKLEVVLPHWKLDAVLTAARQSHIYEELAYQVVELHNTHGEYGSGMIGEWTEGRSLEDSLSMIKTKFGGMIRHTKPTKSIIKRIAFCGGSGSFLLDKAIAAEADLFLTADFKYHQFFDADNKIVIADIGHFEIEQFTSQLIVDHLRQKFTTFAPRISTVNTNPVGYY